MLVNDTVYNVAPEVTYLGRCPMSLSSRGLHSSASSKLPTMILRLALSSFWPESDAKHVNSRIGPNTRTGMGA